MRRPKVDRPAPRIRCAIYTRKSTEEGLDKDFNSLDAQRQAAEAYIKSQGNEGWICLPSHYDDGGFTGGNMDRPALKRLLADIQAGEVDAVVTYKVDRLSRSLLDFARIIELFEKHGVSFVSVTQQFNTATSMGRLVLNVLLSFAQFEREIISERTRDKISAARRKGKWVGGRPLLGYDVDPQTLKLVINQTEAKRVRTIFELYCKRQGLVSVLRELHRRGWQTKGWQSRKGHQLGGKPFNKSYLRHLLSNPAYLGKVRYKNELHAGEHAAIVDHAIWQEVQRLLREHGEAQRQAEAMATGAMLRGLLHCQACGTRMTPTHANGRGGRRYDYYTCVRAIKHGRHTCPVRSLPASDIERFVWQQLVETLNAPAERGEHRPSPGQVIRLDPMMVFDKQAAAIRDLVQRVDYDGAHAKVVITLREARGREAFASSQAENGRCQER